MIWADVVKTKNFYTSQSASIRLRTLIPMQHFKQKYEISLVHYTSIETNFYDYFKNKNYDIVIFQKSYSFKNVEIIKYIQSLSCKVIFEVGDNHFLTPQYRDHYIEMCNQTDIIVVGVRHYFDFIPQITNREKSDIRFVDNPLEFSSNTPHCINNNLLWFGHSSNLDPLLKLLPKLKELSKHYNFKLSVITQGSKQYIDIFKESGLNIKLIEFSLDAVENEFKQCDIVVLPTRSDGMNLGKSSNRVFDSINAGMFVVADDNIEAYQEFKNYSIIQKDIISGLVWTFNNKEQANKLIALGQKHISQKYSPQEIASQWEQVFQELLD